MESGGKKDSQRPEGLTSNDAGTKLFGGSAPPLERPGNPVEGLTFLQGGLGIPI
jgi:hypothetical protein